jgi:putative spermidine/putrescine transport system permease protein
VASNPYMTASQRTIYVGLRIFGVLFCIYLVGPIIAFVPLSFSDTALFRYPIERFSLRWFDELFSSAEWSRAFLNSLCVGTVSTLLATLLGVCGAIGISRARFPAKNAIMIFLMTPMIVPTVVSGIGMYFAFARVGLDNTYAALILAHTALATPMVVITVSAVLARFDDNLLRAAANLGAAPVLAFRRIMLPLIVPGVISGAIFAFAISFDDVVAALFLAGPDQRTLPVQMYMRAGDLFDLVIAAAATVTLVIAICLMTALQFLKKNDKLSAGSSGASPK